MSHHLSKYFGFVAEKILYCLSHTKLQKLYFKKTWCVTINNKNTISGKPWNVNFHTSIFVTTFRLLHISLYSLSHSNSHKNLWHCRRFSEKKNLSRVTMFSRKRKSNGKEWRSELVTVTGHLYFLPTKHSIDIHLFSQTCT